MSSEQEKIAVEDTVDAAAEDQEVAPPAEDVVEDGLESKPKENGTSENTTDSNDGEQAEDDEEPAIVDNIEERPNLKRASTDALDVPGADDADAASPEKIAKVEEPSDASKEDD